MKVINVGIGEIAVSSSPDILKTILGSCVGVVIYSPADRIGGLIHIMLPRSTNGDMNHAKYADTGIPMLIDIMETRYGIKRRNLVSKIAGGANMFYYRKTGSPLFDIGTSNIAAVKQLLKESWIPILEEDTGANYGRRIEFYLETGKMAIYRTDKGGGVI